ncbi:M13 family metallopeptidase [Roseateles amylovorans]|uniref:M13 family metallopeptidase n=1 Tax=Roseateles amylovorans TaxID=2978473 RepID=A0ABY6B525_9BURK|nr:M13 family metallopeptidase [Roseateles amylovorans]UXH79402.1 M13 family metallopeptidase [Roseateles amylovorans]
MFRPALMAAAVAAALSAAPVHALDVKSFAADVSPCADFYDYVNGPWVAATELPADRSRIGSFDALRVANDRLLSDALAELIAKPKLQTTPGLKQVAAYYASGMDQAAIEAQGLKPVQPLLDRIQAMKSVEDLPAVMAQLARVGIAAPVGEFVRADPKNTRVNVLTLAQSGLGLPDRDDYFKDTDIAKKLREAYRLYAQRLLSSAGFAATPQTLDALIGFESQLAEATKPRAALRDPLASYNPMTTPELAGKAPGLAWDAYLKALTRSDTRPGGVERLIVAQPEFMQRVALMSEHIPLATWQTYLRLRVLDNSANRLPKAFADAHFDYYGATISGLQARSPRNEEVILLIGGRTGGSPLGLALGELFVSKAFSPEAQRRATLLIGDVKAAMHTRIENLTWMSPETKVKALEKLAAMQPKIGAPEKWPQYVGLALQPKDFAGNQLRAASWYHEEQIKDLDRPTDRTRWTMAPYIVNAQAGGLNEITFPAGILQPPFFDAKADDAVNYGGIGMVIGHEIVHHFDDRGRQFDSIGSLNDWWTASDAENYKSRADRVVALYESYEPVPGTRINGRLTLGENISDMAGMPIAFDALQNALKRTGKTDKIDGFSQEQRFFLSNAMVWRNKSREAALLNQLRTDPHSPGKYRVLAPMSNMTAFSQAFNCKSGDAMVAADPIKVW